MTLHTTRRWVGAVAVVLIVGCTPAADGKKQLKDSTAREVLETWNRAGAERDWETWFECMTPEARDGEKAGLLIACGLALSEARNALDSRTGSAREVLQAWIEKMDRPAKTCKENDRFALEVLMHMDAPESPRKVPKDDPSRIRIENIEHYGKTAKARVTRNGAGPRFVWLKRVAGHWRIDARI